MRQRFSEKNRGFDVWLLIALKYPFQKKFYTALILKILNFENCNIFSSSLKTAETAIY